MNTKTNIKKIEQAIKLLEQIENNIPTNNDRLDVKISIYRLRRTVENIKKGGENPPTPTEQNNQHTTEIEQLISEATQQ